MTYGQDHNAIVGYRPQAQVLAAPMPVQFQLPPTPQPDAPEAGIVQILWRRKWIVLFTVFLAVAAGWFYLERAPRLYTSTAKIAIEPTLATVTGAGGTAMSEGILLRQAERIRSTKVLQTAVDLYELDKLESLGDNPVLTLKRELSVEVGRRDEIISVSFTSPYPEEAGEIVNRVVEAYMALQAQQGDHVQEGILEVFKAELDKANTELEERKAKLTAFKLANPSVALEATRGDIIFQRMQEISAAHTRAQLDEIQARTAYESNQSVVTRRAWERSRAATLHYLELLNEVQREAHAVNAKAAEYRELELAVEQAHQRRSELERRMNEMQLQANQREKIASIEILEEGRKANLPYSPTKGRVFAIAVAAGFVLGMGAGLLRDWMDQRLRSAEEVMAALGVPVLGTIPHMSRRYSQVQRGQKVFLDPMSEVAEAFRTVRTAVYFGARSDKSRTLLITSAMPGDGKSTSASNLAIAMAQAGQRTLLLDCDFRKPTQHIIFEVDPSVGVSTVLAGREPLDKAIQRTAVEGLDILPGGPIPLNPSEILNSQAFSDMVDELATRYDHIVIDSPPVNAVTDARILGALCDVTLIVLRAEKTTRKHTEYARDALMSVGARILGCIVNDVSRGKSRSGFYSGYGYYGHAMNAVTITQGPARVPPRRMLRSSAEMDIVE